MTMKYLNKNVSAENESVVFDIDVKRDESGKAKNVILKYKNFYTEEVSDDFYDFLRDFYTKQEIDERIKVHLKIYETKELLNSATDEDAKKENFIYLVPYEGEEDNFEEYIWTKDENGNYSYEKVGSTKVDLTPVWEAIDELDESKVDKEDGKGLSTNDFNDTCKTKLKNIENYANNTIVDESLSSESENPLQNKVIKLKIDEIEENIQALKDVKVGKDFGPQKTNKNIVTDSSGRITTEDKIEIDNEVKDDSENPVQNKVIKSYVDTTVADSFQDMSDKLYGTEQTAGDLSVYLTSEDIYNGLDNSSTKLALSANQGRELKNALDGKANESHMHLKSHIQNFPAIVDDLKSTDGVDSALSANQGRVLKAMIDNIEVGSVGEHQHTTDEIFDDATGYSNNFPYPVNNWFEGMGGTTEPIQQSVVNYALAYSLPQKENIENKVTTLDDSDEHYPTTKAVSTAISNAISNIEVGDIDLEDYVKSSELATVATSGNYNDLQNLPDNSINKQEFVGYNEIYAQDLVTFATDELGADLQTEIHTGLTRENFIQRLKNDIDDNIELEEIIYLYAESNISDFGGYNSFPNRLILLYEDWNPSESYSKSYFLLSYYKDDVIELISKNRLATIATSGEYNDLLNKPTIPEVPTVVDEIQDGNNNVVTSNAVYDGLREIWKYIASLIDISTERTGNTLKITIDTNNPVEIDYVLYEEGLDEPFETKTASTKVVTITDNRISNLGRAIFYIPNSTIKIKTVLFV